MSLWTAVEKTEKKEIIKALKESDCDMTEACRKLNISRTTLYVKMEKYKIRIEKKLIVDGEDED